MNIFWAKLIRIFLIINIQEPYYTTGFVLFPEIPFGLLD